MKLGTREPLLQIPEQLDGIVAQEESAHAALTFRHQRDAKRAPDGTEQDLLFHAQQSISAARIAHSASCAIGDTSAASKPRKDDSRRRGPDARRGRRHGG
jgi:hypothetical protein